MVSASPAATWLACSVSVSTRERGRRGDAGEDRGEERHADARAARDRGKGGERAHEHHAFHAEVENAGALGDQLAERGVGERDRRG